MPQARPVAGVIAWRKFTAGRWAPLVDTAGSLYADLAGERGAARAAVVGAAQAAQVLGEAVRQARRHAAAVAFEFLHGKIHAETGAASTAAEARVGHGGCTKKRPKPLCGL